MTLIKLYAKYVIIGLSFGLFLKVSSENVDNGVRGKRGAAYAGPHPGGGYGVGGVGIPGLNNVIQYSAYNQLLQGSNHGQSSGYGGGSSHGRKLTVDQAIGMFGHHTLNRQYPYTAEHGSGGGGGHGGGRGSGGGSSGGGAYGSSSGGGGSGSYGR